MSFTLQAVNAPVTTAGTAIPGQQVTVPVTVTGFSKIGSFYLNLEYDYANLQFVSASPHPSLTGFLNYNDTDRGNGIHRLIISWSGGINGVSLPDGSSIVNYVLNFTSGPATLRWYLSGPYCQYTDPKAIALEDTPKLNYYLTLRKNTDI